MILSTIRKTMKGAIENLSKKESIEVTRISVFIHTKDPENNPKYMYSIDGKLKRDEEGSIVDLNFKNDILNVKIDMLSKEAMAANFLRGYFSSIAESEQIPATSIYVRIDAKDENLSELVLGLYNRAELIRPMKLEDIFGD